MTTLVDHTSHVLLRNSCGDTLHKEAAEAERHSQSRKQSLSSHEAIQRLDKSLGDRRFDIAALRRRIRPGREKNKEPGNEFTVSSNQPNRGWAVEHGNGACKNRGGGRHGKPPARRG